MKMRKIVKLDFSPSGGRVHFGNGLLEETKPTFCADTLFSALFLEELKLTGDDKTCEWLNQIKLTDTFPFFLKDNLETFFLPKPIAFNGIDGENKKLTKSIKFIPVDKFKYWIDGKCSESELKHLQEQQLKIGKEEVAQKAQILRSSYIEKDDKGESIKSTELFSVGTFQFEENAGLWFMVEIEDKDYLKFKNVIKSLSYSGVGGKRSSGLGRFNVSFEDIEKQSLLQNLLKVSCKEGRTCMTLTTCYPEPEELDKICFDKSSYKLVKRSGYVFSLSYRKVGENYRKTDFYKFAAGSCFTEVFDGDIFDVSESDRDNHKVWSYAKPIWIGWEQK
jgi:CRISPR-associated protein Csm4